MEENHEGGVNGYSPLCILLPSASSICPPSLSFPHPSELLFQIFYYQAQ